MSQPTLQPTLFEPADLGPAVRAAPVSPQIAALAAQLHARWGGRLHLGTSSWHFPGWAGWVWERSPHSPLTAALLSREGLAAYAQHPLLRTVSLDRAFYRPLDPATYARLAAQAGDGFRFVVKAPALVTDAVLRDAGTGAASGPNPLFLDADAALAHALRPAIAGLGAKLGVLVFQLSPLPKTWLDDPQALLLRLEALWQALRSAAPAMPAGALLALELRDPSLLTPALAASLKAHGVRYCLGLHDRMPPAQDQLPLLRATWPGDLVCRWNLQRGQRYAQARDTWAPFDRMQAPDLATRHTLVQVLRATLDAGHRAFITINNKAEGSAPASVIALAMALLDRDPTLKP